MPSRPSVILGLAAALCFPILAPASPPPVPIIIPESMGLPQALVHASYNDGNFDQVIADLEEFMRTHRTYSTSDSIFIAKHLAVMYTANPATREKGKYYMNRLLELLPSAKLVDMYVSEEIDRIFDKVREEFISRQHSFGIDTSRISAPARPIGAGADSSLSVRPSRRDSSASPPASSGRKRRLPASIWLAAGGAGLVAAGTVTFLILNEKPEAEAPVTYEIP